MSCTLDDIDYDNPPKRKGPPSSNYTLSPIDYLRHLMGRRDCDQHLLRQAIAGLMERDTLLEQIETQGKSDAHSA